MRGLGAAGIALGLWACAPETESVPPGVATPLSVPSGEGAGQAHLAGGDGGLVIVSWQEPAADGGVTLRMSTLSSDGWSQAQTVAEGANWFVNWADYPSVVPLGASQLIAHWLPLKPDERYAYDISYALSADGGRSWSEPRVLNADEAIAEHGFVSFFEWGDDIGAIWLDGRVLAALTIDELFELEEPVGMTLRYARMDRSGTVLERGEIDDLVCDCCQTDAVVAGEAPLIVYRDRSTEEIRDIAVRRALPSGARSATTPRWSEPQMLGPDGWEIDGCPVNGPAVDASGEQVVVAWFTAAQNEPRLRFARSRDAGRTFEPGITVSDDRVLGQSDVVLTDDGIAWVSAWHRAESGMELRVHRIGADAAGGDYRVAAATEESFPSDVPQMVLSEAGLVLAWSHIGSPGRMYSATLSLW